MKRQSSKQFIVSSLSLLLLLLLLQLLVLFSHQRRCCSIFASTAITRTTAFLIRPSVSNVEVGPNRRLLPRHPHPHHHQQQQQQQNGLYHHASASTTKIQMNPPHTDQIEKDSVVENERKSDNNNNNNNYNDGNNNMQNQQNTDMFSQGIVSFLTDAVNLVLDPFDQKFTDATQERQHQHTLPAVQQQVQQDQQQTEGPATSPYELLERIRDDYSIKNYLWTGDLDVQNNFVPSCTFTDPTLSFIGTDTYQRNIQNLRTVLNLVVSDINLDCQSKLLDIQLYNNDDKDVNNNIDSDDKNQQRQQPEQQQRQQQYIQTRWNMIGTLSKLPWKPRIDVIGRTKFWYKAIRNKTIKTNHDNDDGGDDCYYQIYFYDEIWEIPSYQALLQLITPGVSS